MALAVLGVRRRDPLGLVMAVAGGALAYRGGTGVGVTDRLIDRTPAGALPRGPQPLRRAVTVARPRHEIRVLLREMPAPLTEIIGGTLQPEGGMEVVDDGLDGESFRWRLAGPGGERELRLDLAEAPGDRGTEVHLTLPPADRGVAARLVNRLPGPQEQQLATFLRRFKQFVEAGELATTDGQASGRPKIPGIEGSEG